MTLNGDFGLVPWMTALSFIVLVALSIFLRRRLGAASKIASVQFIDPRRRIVEVVGNGRRHVIFLGPNNDFLIETLPVEPPHQG